MIGFIKDRLLIINSQFSLKKKKQYKGFLLGTKCNSILNI
jgi:hypothetical protein